jgi:hypothetical protein
LGGEKGEDMTGDNKENQGIFNRIKDIIAIILSLSGISIAIFWLTGRSYASGFFSAMNIPSYLLNFSIYEYAEVSWYVTISSIAIIIFLACLLVSLSILLQNIILNKVIPFFNQQKKKVKKKNTNSNKTTTDYTYYINILIGSATLLVFIWIILVSQSILFNYGETIGKERVTNSTTSIDILLAYQLDAEGGTLMTTQYPNGLHGYSGLHLLIYNNGKYYLFSEINPDTCKPVKVYVLNENDITNVILYEDSKIITKCGNK